MTVKHKCPHCQCDFPTSRALEFEPDLDTWLAGALTTASIQTELTTNEIYSAYAAWCGPRGVRLTQSRLTRHLRAKGYQFKHYGSMNKLIGYRLTA